MTTPQKQRSTMYNLIMKNKNTCHTPLSIPSKNRIIYNNMKNIKDFDNKIEMKEYVNKINEKYNSMLTINKNRSPTFKIKNKIVVIRNKKFE